MTLHDHPIEWVWLGFTVIDVWVSTSSWNAARRDWKRAENKWKTLTPNERIEKAGSYGVTYAVHLTSFGNAIFGSLLCASAITSLFLPPPPPSYLSVKQSLYVIAYLIGATILNTFLSVYGRLVRWRIQTNWYEREERHRQAGKPAGTAIAHAYEDVDAGDRPVGDESGS